MLKTHFSVDGIPCTLWGVKSEEKVILAVHGNFSHKEDTCIEILAEEAVKNGYQVLSFDLPAHGDRIHDEKECHVIQAVSDIQCIHAHVRERFSEIALFACSMGASFSLIALQPGNFSQTFFLSPVVDLLGLVRKMMHRAGIDEEQLFREKVIAVTDGSAFRADYVDYLRQHPPAVWEGELSILIGSEDTVADYADVQRFSRQQGSAMEVVEGAEHYFHKPVELERLRSWLRRALISN
ncbi:alpha/beta fold hydrolase [Salmonella enterica subsp. enterica serovar Muenchen]|nr:alpha/beta fold hydrolase [Salmonella enterica subsp. enterica serovar Muenchen]